MSAEPHLRIDNRPLGVMMMLLAMFVICITDAAGKWVLQTHHVAQLNFVRGIFALLVLAPTALKEGGLVSLRTKRPLAHIARGLLLAAMSYAWFFGLTRIPLAEATAIGLCAPLCITALSIFVLNEKVGPFRWTAVVVGFAGMLLIVRPGSDFFDPMFLLPAFTALGYGFYMISNRILSRTESITAITLYPQLAIFLVSAAFVPMVWEPLTWPVFAAMTSTGVTAGLAHLLLTYAFRYAPPSVLAPLEYTALVWATVFGFVVFGHLPAALTWAGAALIVGAGLVVIYRETLAARRAAAV